MAHTAPNTTQRSKLVLYICVVLALATLALYWRVTHHDFVNFDDFDFVTANPHVQAGMTWDSIKWAFSLHTEVARNWHPLTMLTHMLDCQLFGLNAGMHHFVTLLYHIANTVLLFLVIRKMTGATWRSAIVAMLFAVHPLHVESVAWTAERKDVLSTLFWLLVMWHYVDYARTRNKTKYWLTFLFLALGLMSKPMLVTMPFVLLLMDYWPLRRMPFMVAPVQTTKARIEKPARTSDSYVSLILEKIPFFILSLLLCVITFNIQKTGGAMLISDYVPLASRISNALISYNKYIIKMFVPENLAGLYLRHGEWPIGLVAGAALVLIVLSVIAIVLAKRKPYFTFGWFFYVGTLVPVIGIIQVGMQAMADRFTYVPVTGLFIVIVWGVADVAKKFSIPKPALGAAAVAAGVACAVVTAHILPFWTNSETLFKRMIAVDNNNYMAHYNLGNFYSRASDKQAAINEYDAAIKAEPNYSEAHNNLGGVLQGLGRHDEAIHHYAEAARINHNYTYVLNLANSYVNAARFSEAIPLYDEAMRIDPNQTDARTNCALAQTAWGNQLANSNQLGQAEAHYRSALQLNPSSADAMNGLALCLAREGNMQQAANQFAEASRIRSQPIANPLAYTELALANYFSGANKLTDAIPHYQAAAQLDPTNVDIFNGLGVCYGMLGRMEDAAKQFSEVLRLHPDDAAAHGNLGNALAAQNKFDEAIVHYQAAIKNNATDFQAHFNLALTYSKTGRVTDAVAHLKESLRINPNYPEAQRALAELQK